MDAFDLFFTVSIAVLYLASFLILFIKPLWGIGLILAVTLYWIITRKAFDSSSPVVWRILFYSLLSAHVISQLYVLFTGGVPEHPALKTDLPPEIVMKKNMAQRSSC
jgi:hypothetical protein